MLPIFNKEYVNMRAKTTFYAFFDIFSVSLIFLIFLLVRPEPFVTVFYKYLSSFLLFMVLWLIISLAIDKYNFYQTSDLRSSLRKVILANVLILGMATSLIYFLRVDYFSRTVVFGTIITATLLEVVWTTVYFYVQLAAVEPPQVFVERKNLRRNFLRGALSDRKEKRNLKANKKRAREEAILVEIDQEAFDFIFKYARIDSSDTLIISTTSQFNIQSQLEDQFEAIVNLKRINDFRYINKFFEAANSKLPMGGLFIDFVESKNLRKRRILRKYPPGLNYIAYTVDFIVKRVFPKFALTKKIYFFLTRGQNRVLTKAETFGRLYSCGFEVIDECAISNHLFFVCRKISDPLFPEHPTYGPFVKLERIGYKGKIIKVYKLRTMHPYSEYIQEMVFQKQGLQEGGKFNADFRVSTLGRFLRTFWLDELPMLVNVLKGEMKIVGVRPLSRHYFGLYTRDLQKRRIRYKPGLIPPFYADNPKTLQEIMDSENGYMDAYDKHPFITDVKYFFRAIFNIIFRRYRSK